MPAVWPDDLEHRADIPAMFDQDTADQSVTIGRVRRPGRVNSVEFIPGWTQAGTNTNFRTLNLVNQTSGLTVATLALTSGVDLTRGTAKPITITAANARIAVGDVLVWTSVATATGAADPGGQVIVQQTLDN